MKIIVPLAGPDFIQHDGKVKAEYLVDKKHPLLKWVLYNRSWHKTGYVQGEDYYFVMKDANETRRFSNEKLKTWFPGCKTIFTPCDTKGAALSALLGCAALENFESEPLCIDLADIYYEEQIDIEKALINQDNVAALALAFKHNSPVYSYLRLDKEGWVCEAKEKMAISNNASAGTYFYINCITYLKALAYTLENSKQFEHNNLQFVCPVYNGVLSQQKNIAIEIVNNVKDIKITAQK